MDGHTSPNGASYPLQEWDTHTSSAVSVNTITSPEKKPNLPTTLRAVKDSSSRRTGRTLVICLDGTGDKYDNDNSNIVNFVACLKKDDASQITYYQTGIGTYTKGGLLKSGVSSALDGAVGSGLGIHVRDAYSFLMQNYLEGDKICLFGFSRGAYTIRCLTGMLHKVGLLPAYNSQQLPFAYEFYKDGTPKGAEMAAGFKKTFCIDVSVYFLGMYDCVGSVGFFPRKLPFDSKVAGKIAHFRHAMALDEHRAKFKVRQWRQAALDNMHTAHNAEMKEEDIYGGKDRYGTSDVAEVWFMGCHADVGGGAVANGERHMLSRIPLRWMIRQCFECNTGILFGTASLAETGLDVPTLFPVYQEVKKPIVGPSPNMIEKYEQGILQPLEKRSTVLRIDEEKKKTKVEAELRRQISSAAERRRLEAELLPEQVEDWFDSLAPINDMLEIAKGWWVLEAWPVKVRLFDSKKDHWRKAVRMNLGRYRAVREHDPKMHWTVEARIEERAYKLKNRVDTDAVWSVTA